MRNYFHLAVERTQPNLSVGMKWLQGTWVDPKWSGFGVVTSAMNQREDRAGAPR